MYRFHAFIVYLCYHTVGEITSVLDDAKELLADWTASKPKSSQKWEVQIQKSIDNWESLRPDLLHNAIRNCAVRKLSCELCGVGEAIIRCEDCYKTKHLCVSCDITVHAKHPLHDRQGALNGIFQAIPPNLVFDSTCTNLVNISKYSSIHIIIV